MTDTSPFKVYPITDPHPLLPDRRYQLIVEVGEYEHLDVFEQYGFTGNGPSWAEHIQYILEEHDPELLDHLEPDEEGSTYVAYIDSAAAVERFLGLVRPYFASREKLAAHFSQLDPEAFFELD